MASDEARVGIDEIVEAAAAGVLRALEARRIDSSSFTAKNGFFVNVHVIAGGYPGTPEKPVLSLEAQSGQ